MIRTRRYQKNDKDNITLADSEIDGYLIVEGEEKTIKQLKSDLKKLEKIIKISCLYKGKISIGDETVTTEELEKARTELIAEIEMRYSEFKLRLIK